MTVVVVLDLKASTRDKADKGSLSLVLGLSAVGPAV